MTQDRTKTKASNSGGMFLVCCRIQLVNLNEPHVQGGPGLLAASKVLTFQSVQSREAVPNTMSSLLKRFCQLVCTNLAKLTRRFGMLAKFLAFELVQSYHSFSPPLDDIQQLNG
jgi:hypothetical protein